MAKLLTAALIKQLKPTSTRQEIRDAGSPGTGLYLHVQAKSKDGNNGGGKSFVLLIRNPHPDKPGQFASSKLLLGPFDQKGTETVGTPVIGMPLTLAGARSLAAEVTRQRSLGQDVVADRKAAKQAARVKAEQGDNGFAAVAKRFIDEHARPETRRWKETAHILGLEYDDDATILKDGLSDRWQQRDVGSITSDEVYRTIDEAKRRGIPGLPCRTKGLSNARGRTMARTLSKFFAWCLQHRLITASPSVGVFVPPAPASRERVLTEPEIVRFWKATHSMNEPLVAMLKLLLLTGCRLREVAGMRRSELSQDDTWTIPGSRTKNGREHVVPLSPLARDIIAKVKVIAGPGFVFTTIGTTPVSGFSKMKLQLDQLIATDAEKDGIEIQPWRLHDLRRTCATMMAESPPRGLGIAPHVVEAVLNHISGHKVGVAGIYNKAEYLPEKRVALDRWAVMVEELVSGRKPNVTTLRGR
jgi:integrase